MDVKIWFHFVKTFYLVCIPLPTIQPEHKMVQKTHKHLLSRRIFLPVLPFKYKYRITERYSTLRCGFICFIFGAVQFLNVLILTLLCVRFVRFTKDG